MGLSGTLGKRFVFQIESQTDNPLRKEKQTKGQPIILLKLFKRPIWHPSNVTSQYLLKFFIKTQMW